MKRIALIEDDPTVRGGAGPAAGERGYQVLG